MTRAELRQIIREELAVLTLTELCQRWRCTRKVVLAKIHRGELAAFRVGERSYRVSMTEVLRIESTRGQAA